MSNAALSQESQDSTLAEVRKRILDAKKNNTPDLDLSRLGLESIPEEVFELRKLKTLSLGNNRLTVVPNGIGQLTGLEELRLQGNRLSAMADEIGHLSALKVLTLKMNKLTKLPESIGQLANLRNLSIAGNPVEQVPPEIRPLKNLSLLYVWQTLIKELPEWISEIHALEHLSAWGNALKHLPESIGSLSRLRNLYLWDCRLRDLPESLRSLTKLEQLLLHGNDELWVPSELLGPTYRQIQQKKATPASPKGILDYFFATRGTDGQELREIKLIVVGRGGAGKTTLINRLRGRSFNPIEQETHGINISPLLLNGTDGPIRARVWDFGGQHVLHAMHEFFLTARSLYVLVLGEREDMAERDATYWLQLVRSYAGQAPIVIVLNKSGGRSREIDKRTMETKYGPIAGWVSTECSIGNREKSGILKLTSALISAAEDMTQLRARFPAKWTKIRQRLEDMSEPYMEFSKFVQICNDLGEVDQAAQERLASDLNELGIALNYAHDPRLRDTTVLRPNWLADGIYAILRANDSRQPKPLAPGGIIDLESLKHIYGAAQILKMLNVKDYPEEKWAFILRLMNLFQLSFPLDDAGKRQLVPILLPVEEPPEAVEPSGEGRIRLRYEFDVVPTPLVPRLLVRLFGLIKGGLQWRRGAVLSYGPAVGKVWGTQDERWIYATVSAPVGEDEARGDLISILRAILSELFAEYKNLSVIEQLEWKGSWVPRTALEEMGAIPREDPLDTLVEEAEL